jgi:hypothetical protein
MIVGPRFGAWLAGRIHLSYGFVLLWPTIHWVIAIGFTVLAIEAVYLLGPNVKQRFGATLPRALLAVTCWIGFSYLLGIYEDAVEEVIQENTELRRANLDTSLEPVARLEFTTVNPSLIRIHASVAVCPAQEQRWAQREDNRLPIHIRLHVHALCGGR